MKNSGAMGTRMGMIPRHTNGTDDMFSRSKRDGDDDEEGSVSVSMPVPVEVEVLFEPSVPPLVAEAEPTVDIPTAEWSL